MLVEAGHDLDEVAGPVAVVELMRPGSRPRHRGRRPASPAARTRRSCRSTLQSPAIGSSRSRSWRSSADGRVIENPSIRFENSGSTASGVTSRPVKPVPPVVITTSTVVVRHQAPDHRRHDGGLAIVFDDARGLPPGAQRARTTLRRACRRTGRSESVACVRHRDDGDAERDQLTIGIEPGHVAPSLPLGEGIAAVRPCPLFSPVVNHCWR